MKAKKIISLFLVSAAAVSLLAGCSSAANGGQSETQTESAAQTAAESDTQTQAETAESAAETQAETTESVTETQAETATESAAETQTESAARTGADGEAAAADTESESGSDTLVVYYSATGNTAAVANTIAEAVGGDLFELVPADPYTSEDLDWTNESSRVSTEYANEDQREVELVASTVDNWDSYDTVFIGYPIWWGIAAWPVNTFVEANDFTGKTVIPFCTSSSSGIGDSGNLLAELAGIGDWQEGMRFRSGASEADIQAWVEELGL